MPIVDSFPGNNETDLAELRIEYLSSIVDFTVIVESEVSHSGMPKPLHFSYWLNGMKTETLFKNVIVLPIDLSKFHDAWEREIATREFLNDYVHLNFPDSHFILSDLDEIPSISQVLSAVREKRNFHFLSPTSYLYANWGLKDSHKNWNRGVIGHTSLNQGPNGGRFSKFPSLMQQPGAHLSWLIGVSGGLRAKVSSTAHQELEKYRILDEVLVAFASSYGIDHLGRFYGAGFGLLDIQDRVSLSEVQQFILLKNPNFFQFELKNNWAVTRWLASSVCTTIWKNPEQKDLIYSTFLRPDSRKEISLRAIVLVFRTILIGLAYFAKRLTESVLNS